MHGKAEILLTQDEKARLQSIARSRSVPAASSLRAKFVLACAIRVPNASIATRFETTNTTVGKWRRRFIERRIGGLCDELRPVAA